MRPPRKAAATWFEAWGGAQFGAGCRSPASSNVVCSSVCPRPTSPRCHISLASGPRYDMWSVSACRSRGSTGAPSWRNIPTMPLNESVPPREARIVETRVALRMLLGRGCVSQPTAVSAVGPTRRWRRFRERERTGVASCDPASSSSSPVPSGSHPRRCICRRSLDGKRKRFRHRWN